MRTEQRNRLDMALRAALAAVLLYAGVHKVIEPGPFVEQVANYQWLPASAPWVAVILPPTEILAAVGMWVLPVGWRRAAALLAALLFAAFTAAVTRAVWLGINVDCGCFGTGSGDIDGWTIARNVVLTMAALGVVALAEPRE